MAKVSLTQAAKDTGVSLPTLSRWRKSGKISAEKNGSGGYIIDTSEYDRIQELRKSSPNVKGVAKGIATPSGTPPETPGERGVLQVEVAVLRERIKDKDQMIQELRGDRDDWKKQAQTLLLQPPTPPQPTAEEPPTVKEEDNALSESQTPTAPFPIWSIVSVCISFLVMVLGAIAFYHSQSPMTETIKPSRTAEVKPKASPPQPKPALPYSQIPSLTGSDQ